VRIVVVSASGLDPKRGRKSLSGKVPADDIARFTIWNGPNSGCRQFCPLTKCQKVSIIDPLWFLALSVLGRGMRLHPNRFAFDPLGITAEGVNCI